MRYCIYLSVQYLENHSSFQTLKQLLHTPFFSTPYIMHSIAIKPHDYEHHSELLYLYP